MLLLLLFSRGIKRSIQKLRRRIQNSTIESGDDNKIYLFFFFCACACVCVCALFVCVCVCARVCRGVLDALWQVWSKFGLTNPQRDKTRQQKQQHANNSRPKKKYLKRWWDISRCVSPSSSPPRFGSLWQFQIRLQQCHALSVCQCADVDRIAGRKTRHFTDEKKERGDDKKFKKKKKIPIDLNKKKR